MTDQAFLSSEPESWVDNAAGDTSFPWFPEKFCLLSLIHFLLLLQGIPSIQFYKHLFIACDVPFIIIDAQENGKGEAGIHLQDKRGL